jgi:hypothetical protein
MAEEFEDTKRVSEDINLMTKNAKKKNKDKQNVRENNSQTTKDWATRT